MSKIKSLLAKIIESSKTQYKYVTVYSDSNYGKFEDKTKKVDIHYWLFSGLPPKKGLKITIHNKVLPLNWFEIYIICKNDF